MNSTTAGRLIWSLAFLAVSFFASACDDSDGSDGLGGGSGGGQGTVAGKNDEGGGTSGSNPKYLTIQVQMDPTKSNGKEWDFGLFETDDPDPYIVVGGVSYRSQKCNDAYSCQFDDIYATPPVTVEVYDADATDDDYAGSAICGVGGACSTDTGEAIVRIFD